MAYAIKATIAVTALKGKRVRGFLSLEGRRQPVY